jgi:hypothetical protein
MGFEDLGIAFPDKKNKPGFFNKNFLSRFKKSQRLLLSFINFGFLTGVGFFSS